MKERIRREINTSLTDFLERKCTVLDTKPYEDYSRGYVGKVEDNKDPEKIGRCKIRVYGVFDDTIPNEDLPWAVMDPQFCGGSKGSFVVPPIGAIVRVFFNHGDIYAPVYTTKVMDTSTLPDGIETDYPDTMVFYQTDVGDVFKINRKTKETTLLSSSGISIIIDKDGNVNIDTKKAGGKIKLNGENYSICRYQKLKALLDLYFGPNGVFTLWVPIPGPTTDGGLALKTAILATSSAYNTLLSQIESSNNKID